MIHGLNQFRKNPVFGAAVILLLAVGIGANTLVFSLVNELLLKPLPVSHPENLYLLQRISEHNVRPDDSFHYLLYRDVVQAGGLFPAVVAEQTITQLAAMPFAAPGGSVRLVMTQIVSPNYFHELGVPAVLGRVLTQEDSAETAHIPAVLSYQFWQSQFAGDRSVVGREIRIRSVPLTVVGVLPRDFHSSDVDRAPDVRLPVSAARALYGKEVTAWGDGYGMGFRVLVRLSDPAGRERTVAALFPRLASAGQEVQRMLRPGEPPDEPDYRLVLHPIGSGSSQLRDQFAKALQLLLGGVALLLLVVCANVSGLLLAKSRQRGKEMAIRLAMGATRGQLARQLLGEYLVFAAAGSALGAAMAYVLAPEMVRLLPRPRDYGQFASPLLLTVSPDWRILLFTAVLAVFCVFAFGLAPAWRASRTDLHEAMKAAAGQGQTRGPGVIPVALQVAFSMVLVAASLLMMRTLSGLEHLDPGFDRQHVVSFTLDPVDAGYNRERTAGYYRALADKVIALPGVQSVAFSSRGLMRGVGVKTTLAPAGIVLPSKTFMNTSIHVVTPEYFGTLGIPILAGRGLEARDAERQPTPVVVNRALARQFFGDASPIGKLLVQGTDGTRPPGRVIVGLTVTAKYRSMREEDPPTFYEAADVAKGAGEMVLYVRTRGAPEQITGAVRKAATEIDPGVPLLEALTLEQEVQTSLWQEKLVALLAAFFGGVSLLLAGIGLYGTLSFSVAQRTRELGIRVAIGARLADIVRTIASALAIAVACGLAGGTAAAVFLLKITERLLYGVKPLDPASLAEAAILIAAGSVLAAVWPARRAARIQPSVALREE